MPDCIDCGKTRGYKQTVDLKIHPLSGEPGSLGDVSLCLVHLARRDLFCGVHHKPKMAFSDLNKNGQGTLEILGACMECVLSELDDMDDERRDYLANRFRQREPVLVDDVTRRGALGPCKVFLGGSEAIVFALLTIAQMHRLTPEKLLEHPGRPRLH